MCEVQDICKVVPDLSLDALRTYIYKLSRKTAAFVILDLPRGEQPRPDSTLLMDAEWYASWWA